MPVSQRKQAGQFLFFAATRPPLRSSRRQVIPCLRPTTTKRYCCSTSGEEGLDIADKDTRHEMAEQLRHSEVSDNVTGSAAKKDKP